MAESDWANAIGNGKRVLVRLPDAVRLTRRLGWQKQQKRHRPTLPVNRPEMHSRSRRGGRCCCKRVLIDGLCFRGGDDLIDGFLDGLDHLKRGLLADGFAVADALNVCRQDAKQKFAGIARIHVQLLRAHEVEDKFGKHPGSRVVLEGGCGQPLRGSLRALQHPKHHHRGKSCPPSSGSSEASPRTFVALSVLENDADVQTSSRRKVGAEVKASRLGEPAPAASPLQVRLPAWSRHHRKHQRRGRTPVRTFLIHPPPICRASAAMSFDPDPFGFGSVIPRPLSDTVKRPSP